MTTYTPEEIAAMNVATARAALTTMQTEATAEKAALQEEIDDLNGVIDYPQVTFTAIAGGSKTCWVRSGAKLSDTVFYTKDELALEANAAVLPTIWAIAGQKILELV